MQEPENLMRWPLTDLHLSCRKVMTRTTTAIFKASIDSVRIMSSNSGISGELMKSNATAAPFSKP